MKRILIAAFAGLISLSSIAQKGEGKEKKEHHELRKEGHFEEMSEKLNLTEDQKKQVKEINEKFKSEMEQLKNNTSLSQEEKKNKRMEIVKAHRDNLHAVLSKEQQQQAKELKHDKMPHRMHGHAERWNDLTKDLNISADQSSKIKELNETLKANMENLKNNTSLSDEQRKIERKSLMEKHRSDVMALLTEEQKASLKEKRKNFRKEG